MPKRAWSDVLADKATKISDEADPQDGGAITVIVSAKREADGRLSIAVGTDLDDREAIAALLKVAMDRVSG